MPADSKHKLYKRYSSIYTMIYDCKEGERAIKEAGETYLPKLGGQTNTSYAAYKSRGAFLNATGRTITALTGLMMRKDAVVEAPKELEEDFDNITSDNLSLQQLLMECCESSLSYSRQGLLIDADEKGDNPFIAVYNALSILNWRSTFVNGEEVLTMLTLKETAVEVDKEDEFKTNEIEQVRVLTLDKEDEGDATLGKLLVRIFQKKDDSSKWEQVGDDMYPTISGVRLDYIPFVFIGSMSNQVTPEKPILADLASLNIGHWKLEVDYKHGLHLCALPTPWAAGFPKNASLFIGPEKAWVTEDSNAKAGYLEFEGAGMDSIKDALERTEQAMATMGSRILEAQKKNIEAAQTVRIRQGSDIATLSNIASSVESGVEKALVFYALRKGKTEVDIEITINRDFVDADLDAPTLSALLQTVQAGKMSVDTFLWNIKRGELMPPGKSIEEERKEFEAEDEMNSEFDEDNNNNLEE